MRGLPFALLASLVACNAILGNEEPRRRAGEADLDAGDATRPRAGKELAAPDDAGGDGGRADAEGPSTQGHGPDASTAEASTSPCRKDCLGGACVDGVCQPYVLSRGFAKQIVVDPGEDGYVYWTVYNYDPVQGGVFRIAKTGDLTTQLQLAQADWELPYRIALAGDRVCWTSHDHAGDSTQRGVYCARNDGKELHQYRPAGYSPWGFDTDGTNVFWVDRWDRDVLAAPIAEVERATRIVPVAPSTENVSDELVADPGAGGRIYWSRTNQLLSANKDGSDVFVYPGIPVTPGAKIYGGMAVDDVSLYWFERAAGGDWHLYKRKKVAQPGWQCTDVVIGCPQVLADPSVTRGPGERLVSDGDYLYWADNEGGRILRARKDGSQTEVLAAHQTGPTDVAVDARSVYWIANDRGNIGVVLRLAKP